MGLEIVGIVLLAFVGSASAQTDAKVFLNFKGDYNKPNKYVTHVDQVTLNCTVEDRPMQSKVNFERYYNQTSSPVTLANDMTLYDNSKYKMTKIEPSTWELSILNLNERDTGIYRCYIYVTEITAVDATLQMTVYDTPAIRMVDTTTEVTVEEGKSTTLICAATGDPTPEIKWIRVGGGTMPGGGEEYIGGTLFIPKVQADYMGKYRCEATNKVGQADATATLQVLFQPVVSSPYLNDQNKHVAKQKIGHKISILCFIRANPMVSADNVQWSYSKEETGGSVLIPSGEKAFIKRATPSATAKYVIQQVASKDFGYYTCTVTNGKGTTSLTVKLEETDVAQPDQIAGVISGSPVISSVALISLFIPLLFSLI